MGTFEWTTRLVNGNGQGPVRASAADLIGGLVGEPRPPLRTLAIQIQTDDGYDVHTVLAPDDDEMRWTVRDRDDEAMVGRVQRVQTILGLLPAEGVAELRLWILSSFSEDGRKLARKGNVDGNHQGTLRGVD